ncbi:hypothetical protein MMC28_001469 [Mycoblastus sanguinarius]|nr:hypothetical protein [Mycoblastus sanguinarius]
MHITLAITATHDRYLSIPATGRRTVAETYHWSQCAALFNRKLSQPIQPEDRDPLWATAASLGIIALSSVEASTPEEAWPLKPSEPSDLEWLRMSEGKMAVWDLTDPLRPGGIFQAMSEEYAQLFFPIPSAGIDGVPSILAHLCDLDVSSTADTNPYFAAVHTLVQLQNIPGYQIPKSRVLTFVGHMQRSFKTLLREKDPVALLLLALWYSKARRSVWWLEYRATVECQAICLYLQRYHQSNSAIQASLPQESIYAL